VDEPSLTEHRRAGATRVSVVIVTRDRRDSLLAVLHRLRALPERPPIIVVDNGSSDGTAGAVLEHCPDVHVEALPDNRGAAGRTVGVRLARTPYVAFSDDDSWWAPGALDRAAATLDHCPRLAVLAARILVGPQERLDPVCTLMAESPMPAVPGAGPGVLGFVACGAVVRRAAYLAAGGFHDRYGIGGEESLLAIDLARLGWACAYVQDVVAHHHPSQARDPTARRAREVRNDLWTLWLRRRGAAVGRGTAQVLRRVHRDPAARSGFAQAVHGLRWVIMQRASVGPPLERQLRQVAGARRPPPAQRGQTAR
jgi:GT2 family glycosyltransferase